MNEELKTNKIDVLSLEGRMIEKIPVPASFLDMDVDINLLHQIVHWQLSKKRSGNHHTKNRSDINVSTRKTRKQKGTGGARHSTRAANIFRGGAIAWGPVTHSHEININKKVKVLGLKMALNQAIKTNILYVVDSFSNAEAKTKYWQNNCTPWHNKNGCLLIDTEYNDANNGNILRATNNIPYCNFLPITGLNVYDILKNGTILITKEALYKAIERLNYE